MRLVESTGLTAYYSVVCVKDAWVALTGRERERESTDSGKQQRGVLLNTN